MLTFPAIELLALIIGVVLLALLILICIIVFATISIGHGLRGAMGLLKENIFGPGNNAKMQISMIRQAVRVNSDH